LTRQTREQYLHSSLHVIFYIFQHTWKSHSTIKGQETFLSTPTPLRGKKFWVEIKFWSALRIH